MDYTGSKPQRTMQDLQQMQAAPLGVKVGMTIERIRNWVDEYGIDGVCVSFSGGKDSTVLLNIARKVYPDIQAVYIDTGLEYPEIREWVKSIDNVVWVKPKKTFKQVIEKYGYPLISKEVSEIVYNAKKYINKQGGYESAVRRLYGLGEYSNRSPEENRKFLKDAPWRVKAVFGMLAKDEGLLQENHKAKDRSAYNCEKYLFFMEEGAPAISNVCCNVMKKGPVHTYQHKSGLKSMTAQMATESRLRTQQWLRNGCNGFDLKNPISNPMAFWTDQDVLLYIKENNLPICPIYGEVIRDYDSEGLIEGQMDMSDYGIMEKEIPCLKTTGCQRTGCVYCGFGLHLEQSPNRFEKLAVTHPALYDYVMRGGGFTENKEWKPDERGLGFWYCIEWMNRRGGYNIQYPDRQRYLNVYSTEETKRYLSGGS